MNKLRTEKKKSIKIQCHDQLNKKKLYTVEDEKRLIAKMCVNIKYTNINYKQKISSID
jgi:hypothetical protein